MCDGRYRDGGSALYAWVEPEVLVVCPRCSSRAAVRRTSSSARRLTCPSCGFSHEAASTTSTWGEPVDPWFGEPLWLRAELRGHTVWAFNHRHLDALRAYLSNGPRERTPVDRAAIPVPQHLRTG